MTLARVRFTLQDSAGNVITEPVSVELRREDTNALAELYSDSAGATPLGNPFTATPSNGQVPAYALGNSYHLVVRLVSDNSIVAEEHDLAVGTAAATDFGTQFIPSGAWATSNTYDTGDVVSHAVVGSGTYAFASNVDTNIGHEPSFTGTTPQSDAYWTVIGYGDVIHIPVFFPGVLEDADKLSIVMPFAAVFPPGLGSSQAVPGTMPAAYSEFSVQKNGSEFGTVVFVASSAVGTFASAAGATFAIGDLISIVGPNPADASLADVAITLVGNLL